MALCFLLFSCQGQEGARDTRLKVLPTVMVDSDPAVTKAVDLINKDGQTIKERFQVPDGFQRVAARANSFAAYLQNLPLKEHGTKVRYFDGTEKSNHGVYAAVVDMPLVKGDLQQCADAIMRLRGEYLYEQERYDDIKFNFTNGFEASYDKWRKGQRIKVDGNKVSWYNGASPSTAYKDFERYLRMVFIYAGTLSLEKELSAKSIVDIAIGDVFIQGGSPGHAVIVVDMAINEATGERKFLLAQSYMPAQETQILLNPANGLENPWYSNKMTGRFRTPEWTFDVQHLKGF